MASLEVTISAKGVEKLIKRAPGVLDKWLRLAFKQHGDVYRVEMNNRFAAGSTGGKKGTGAKLRSRSGALQDSIGFTVPGGTGLKDLQLIYHVGDARTIKYAETQEDGRVIHGKPWLAIPLPANLTASGKPRIERPSLVMNEPGWFVHTSQRGVTTIGRELENGRLEFFWVLKRKVTIPPRLGFRKTVLGDKLQTDRVKRLNAAVKRALKEVSSG